MLEGAYKVCSLTIKDIERRLDGLVEPDGHDGETKAYQWIFAEGEAKGKTEGKVGTLQCAS